MEDGNRSDIGESGGRRRRIVRLAARSLTLFHDTAIA